MAVEGADWSFSRPDPSKLKAEGIHFGMRYVSTGGNSKNITAAEATALRNAGINVGIIFESGLERATAGKAAGAADARSAVAQVKAAGGPANGGVIYFAVDFDANTAQIGAAATYLSGAASVLGKGRTGVYGGYNTIQDARIRAQCGFFWQTLAWSGGKISGYANLYQYEIDTTLVGSDVDRDRALKNNCGFWWQSGNATPQLGVFSKEPTIRSHDVGHPNAVRDWQDALNLVDPRLKIIVNGSFADTTLRATKNFQNYFQVLGGADGVVGPSSWSMMSDILVSKKIWFEPRPPD